MNTFKDNRQITLKLGITQEHNARSYTLLTTLEASERLDLAILPHPPYSPDLALCDLHILPNMKDDFRWTPVWLTQMKRWRELSRHEEIKCGVPSRRLWWKCYKRAHFKNFFPVSSIKLLKTKRNLLYIRNQSVPRSKHFPPRLQKPISQCCIKQKSLSWYPYKNTKRKANAM
jgi:hypothetical protein